MEETQERLGKDARVSDENISQENTTNELAMGVPVYLRDVAKVQIGPEMRRGIAELNGEGDMVGLYGGDFDGDLLSVLQDDGTPSTAERGRRGFRPESGNLNVMQVSDRGDVHVTLASVTFSQEPAHGRSIY